MRIDDITLIGPHPLTRDEDGNLKYGIADVFPIHRAVVVGPGIHATLVLQYIDFLEDQRTARGEHPLTPEEEDEIYGDLVAVMMRGDYVIIRSDPDDMDRTFRADELLQKIVPKAQIQFTGLRDPKVRAEIKKQGACWRINPQPQTVEEMKEQIRQAKERVTTDNRYYHSAELGGRWLTFQEFQNLSCDLENRDALLARVREIVQLYHRRNNRGIRELNFFIADKRKFDGAQMKDLQREIEGHSPWTRTDRAMVRRRFEEVSDLFREAVAYEFRTDDYDNPIWRTTMFCLLNNIPPTEESFLGLSPEFHMNIRWLPGARIQGREILLDETTDRRTRDLILDFQRKYPDLEYINVGKVIQSQSKREKTGEEREMYLLVFKRTEENHERIHALRKQKRDTQYYLNSGKSLEEAEGLSEEYVQYVFDRIQAIQALGADIPHVMRLETTEYVPGIGAIALSFFDRPYVHGMASDKIPIYRYGDKAFVLTLAELLGEAAALNIIVGRVDPITGKVLFDDGDEIILFDAEGRPASLVLADTTSSFGEVDRPMVDYIDVYAEHLQTILDRSEASRIDEAGIRAIAGAYFRTFRVEFLRIQHLYKSLRGTKDDLTGLFAHREPAEGSIRDRWEKMLQRLACTDPDELIQAMKDYKGLKHYHSISRHT